MLIVDDNNGKMTLRDKAIQLFGAWRNDWNKFASDVFGVTLDKEQQAILASVQTNERTSVVSGTARGKDFVSACAAMCFLYLTPKWNDKGELIANTKVALTAPTDRQVKNIMLPEISRLYHRAKQRGVTLPGRLTAYDIRMENDEWFLTGFKADEHNHEAWSGFHAVNTMFVVTEATGITDDTFAAIEGNMQGNSRELIVFNPNTSIGYAARSQKSDRWSKFRLNDLTAPNVVEKREVIGGQVNYEWVKDKVETWCMPISKEDYAEELDDFYWEGMYYRPSDFFRIKVLGKFPKVSEDALIPHQWLELAHERWVRQKDVTGAIMNKEQSILGVDVAGMGRDSTVYVKRKGDLVVSIRKHNSGGTADHMKVAGEIIHQRQYDPYMMVSIDTIGEGAGVYSRCIEVDKGTYYISCKYSEGAKHANGKDLTDITNLHTFVNMRAYLFWCVRDWLNPKNGHYAMLPPDAQFDEEATEIKWFFCSDGKIQIEPKEDIKKRLGRSTDAFDALANTFYPVQQIEYIDKAKLATIVY